MKEKLTLNDKALIRYSELRHQFVIGIQDFFAKFLQPTCRALMVSEFLSLKWTWLDVRKKENFVRKS